MQRYDTYKDSGVKWLGEIPSHWEMRKMKFSFEERSQKGFPNLPLLAATQNHGVIRKTDYENRTVEATKSLDTLKLVEIGDFVISLRSFQGGIELCYEKGIISPAYTILRPTHITAGYFKHLGKSPIFIQLLKSMVTGIREGQNIDYGKLRENLLPIPPIAEQTAIANYLDTITSKIDAAIAQQQKMIDLLNERKQIIINRAVTKGLNPNAKMKDSGVEWIGKVPEGWEVRRLKTLFNYISRGITPNYVEQSNSRVVNQATFSKGYFDRYNQRFTVAMEYNDSFVRNGDILMASTGGGVLGKVYYFEGQEDNNVADSHVTIIRTDKKEVNGKFYCYLFSTQYDMINAVMAKGSTNQTELQRQELTSLFVPVPTRKEQDEIVKHLDTLSEQIETIIVQYRNQISLLQERKQIIINEVVTGKVRVG